MNVLAHCPFCHEVYSHAIGTKHCCPGCLDLYFGGDGGVWFPPPDDPDDSGEMEDYGLPPDDCGDDDADR